jgi:hypothetical protein
MGVRERFINSIEYLRKLGFFEEYSNLTSEEIFEKVKGWSRWVSWDEKEWEKDSDFNVDRYALAIDSKRSLSLLIKWDDTFYPEKRCAETLEKLASFSRGAFQPTGIEYEEVKEWTDREKSWPEKYEVSVHFKFRGQRRTIKFPFSHEWLGIDEVLAQINHLIRDTEYQYYLYGDYYRGLGGGEFAEAYVLTKKEVRKLVKERGWELYHPVLIGGRTRALKIPARRNRGTSRASKAH